MAGDRDRCLGWRPGGPRQTRTMARRHRRPGRAPLLAPLVALLGLILVAGGSVFAASKLDLVGGAAATATPFVAVATEPPGQTYDPDATDTPGPAATPRAPADAHRDTAAQRGGHRARHAAVRP